MLKESVLCFTLVTYFSSLPLTESLLGASCSITNCDGDREECVTNQCQCQVDFYDDNNAAAGGNCKNISDLKVTNVRATVLGTTSLYVTWTNPAANGAVEEKQVRWTGITTGLKVVVSIDTSTDVTGLTPGGNYTINVVSIDTNSRISQQEQPSDFVIITTKPAVPGEIMLNIPDVSGTIVRLSWLASVGIATSYTVVFEGENGDIRTQITSTNSINMTSLIPAKKYNITITAKSGTMLSDHRYGTTRTAVAVPGAPTDFKCVFIMDTSVILSWIPPGNPNGDIMYYLINVKYGPGSPRTVNTTKPVQNMAIDQLSEDEYYSFTIRTRNNKYTGPESLTANCKTKPGLPSKPQNLSILVIHSRNLTVRWQKPDKPRGILIGYRLVVTNGSICYKEILFRCSNCVQQPSLISSCIGDSKITLPITNTDLTNETFMQTVEGLFPYISYSVSVNAITEAGDGQKETIIAKTDEEVPGAPTGLQCITVMDTNVTLSWNQPVNPNGYILYYLIDIKYGPGSPRTVNTTTPVQIKVIDQLSEGEYYSFSARARNTKYTGPESFTTTCKTKPGLPLKPQNLLITVTHSRNFTVEWMKPNATKGSLIGYRIIVKTGTTCVREVLFKCSNCLQQPNLISRCIMAAKISIPITKTGLDDYTFEQTVEGLLPYVNYSVSVNGITEAGDGHKETTIVITKEEVPGQPTDLRCISITESSLTLTWNPPINPNGYILYYLISVKHVQGSFRTVNTTKPVQTQNIYQLAEEEDYSFTVRAKNNMYTGLESFNIICKTKPGLPSKPQNLFITVINSRNFTIGWTKPNRTKGSLTGYRIVVMNGTICSKEILFQCSNCLQPPIFSSSCILNARYTLQITDTGLENHNFIKTVEGLVPHVSYTVSVNAITGAGDGQTEVTTVKTKEEEPGAPTGLKCILVMETSVTLSWVPPINPNGDIMYYLINITYGPGSPKIVNTTKTVQTMEIAQLAEDENYFFTIRARNNKYTGPESLTANCKTKPGLSSKPQYVFITFVTSRQFTVGWKKPNSTKGNLIGYRILVKNQNVCFKEILYKCSDCVQQPSLASNCPVDGKITLHRSLNNDAFTQTVKSLLPFVSYNVSVNAITGAGDGQKQTTVVKTKEEAPQNLTNVSADVLNSTAIKLIWSIPDPRPGVTKYTINVYDDIDGKQKLNKTVEVTGFYERSKILTNLEEYWQYFIHIKASTNIGQSATKTVTPDKTLPTAPGQVSNFRISRPEYEYKSATIKWSIPSLRDRNSLITSYELKHNSTGILAGKIINQTTYTEDMLTESITVQPGNYYYVEVFAINNVKQPGVKISEVYYAPTGPPPNLDALPGVKVIQKDTETSTTKTTATVLLFQDQFLADSNGKILSNGLILCPKNLQYTTQSHPTFYDSFITWKKAKKDGFKQCYRPTNSSWIQNQKAVTVTRRSTNKRISYTIGEDTTCNQKPENNYCNGPLNPGSAYKAFTFVCTKDRCTESQPLVFTTVQNETPTILTEAVIGTTVTVAAILALVIIVVIIVKRRKNNSAKRNDDNYADFQMNPYENHGENAGDDKTYTSLCEENKISRFRPFSLSSIYQFLIEMHNDRDLKFAKEFQDLEILSPKDECLTAKLQINSRKNRHEEILPFDRTRVKFKEDTNKYINASHLKNFRNRLSQEFIVTQHPLSNTIEDFWTMIWEQNVSVIIMLTPKINDNQLSYWSYFPAEPQSSIQYGSINVKTMAKCFIHLTELSSIQLKKGRKSKMIKHFYSSGWNDIYDNRMQTEIVQLIEAVKSNIRPSDKLGPTMVHCGYGTGRSGVFIALYQLMDCIHDNTVDIFDLVLTMRESRMQLVEFESQYIFIHDCFHHMISEKITKAHTDENAYDYIHI